MPIRIYALAKELKIDSKDLVDICTKAGITGKGSALASLDDDEITKVKTYLKAGTAKPAAKPATELKAGPAPPAEPAPLTRKEVFPLHARGKIKVIETKSKKPPVETKEGEEGAAQRKPKRRAPVINVAPIPEVKQPPAVQPAEPRAQKPDIRLPKDAIVGHKKGVRPPLEHLTKTEAKPKPAAGRKPAGEPVETAPLGRAASRGRRGKADDGEGGRGLAGLASARADRQKARKTRARARLTTVSGDDDTGRARRSRTLTHKGTNTAAPRKGKIIVDLPCTVRSFSECTGVGTSRVMMTLMKLGLQLTINEQVDQEYVDLLAAELGLDIELRHPESLETSVVSAIVGQEDEEATLEPRPPVVTFLGHVDHGKTSLLDYLIGTNVVAGEAGGITQHIRAYQIPKDGRMISFVDTPGHEAFTEMRARGAHVTDIAVLVIAAEDGIMPQTEEAISHAKAANVPIVVALNKMDLPGADANRCMTQMTEHGLTPSEWGGDIEVIRTSAVTGQGMNELLETLLGIADLHELKANPKRQACGTCLEAQQEAGRGVVAKLIVQKGTLHVGDIIVCGSAHGRVKAMYDTLRTSTKVESAGPSTPVNVMGLDEAPEAGEAFVVLDDIAVAREIASQRSSRTRERSLSGQTTRVSFEEFQRRLEEGRLSATDERVTLNLIIRADVRGSIEAIEKELSKLDHPEVQVKILHKAVGAITLADVTLAHASEAVIVGFNVIPEENARNLADERGVEIRRYDVIYKVTDDIKAMLEGKLKPEERLVELGQALVKQVFAISRLGSIAGCYVVRGTIERGCRIRVNRDGRTIGDYPLESLRRLKDDVKEVSRGLECGIKLAGFNDVKKDDLLEAYKIEEVARTL